jgi:hypothetical protein
METKPGVKTTEFWAMMGVYLGGVVNITGVWDWTTNYRSGLLMTIATSFYALARGVAKANIKPDA